MDQTTLIGAGGASIVLIAFIMNQFHVWKDDYLIYDLFNFAGSALLLVYAIILSSYPFIVLNTVWGGLSLRDVLMDFLRNGRKHAKGGGF